MAWEVETPMVPPTNWETKVVSNVTVCYLTKSVENLHRIDDTATAISAREEMPCATISGTWMAAPTPMPAMTWYPM